MFGPCLTLIVVRDKLSLPTACLMLAMFSLTTAVYIFVFEVGVSRDLLITELIKSSR